MRRSLADMGCKRDVSLEEFFNARYRIDEKGCWIWTGKINKAVSGGYGEIRRKRGTPTYKAHRVSFEMHKGPIPDDMCVCHKCDVRACVNPDHLFLGTKADNNADMHGKGRNGINPLKGEESTSSKLKSAEVMAIFADTRPTRLIALEYNVSQQHVSDIQTKKKWKHLHEK